MATKRQSTEDKLHNKIENLTICNKDLQAQYQLLSGRYARAIEEHKAEMLKTQSELVVVRRLVKIIKATCNGITIIGEDERDPETHEMVRETNKTHFNG